ncbi:hypothetical protein QJS04_geneDACA016570 [Acorus gramineus]|uniref:C2 domain-containing protein n=1 Tax=Acorus gramineus TaxID=55184 RepID=A0AAV9BP51_ACOGR|nr:hypothetical protein QJS04_geneDACA016570 [Acorus gramineus]
MDSFKQSTTTFHYNLSSPEPPCLLDLYVHHARNIHNICIYQNQDVYAKFSLTSNPDETLSTRIVNGGGKNPEFNERLSMKITQPESVLKCEIWMLSRARNYLEDQLLGFALVPLFSLKENRVTTEDYTLSSTDLFHSPAGTVRLTLSLDRSIPGDTSMTHSSSSSISSEVVILDPDEFKRIEFPDINVVAENQQMVSEYFDKMPRPIPFIHLGSSLPALTDCEMSSTTTSLSNDGVSVESVVGVEEKKNPPETPTSKKNGSEIKDISVDAEQVAMQKQIVDMYMRSMQQFTESLAKMKLPMEIDKAEAGGNPKLDTRKKDESSRVFYGSRAFF